MVEQVPYLALCVAAIVVSMRAPAHHRLHCVGAAIWLLCDNIIYNFTWDGRDLVTPEWWPLMTLAFCGVLIFSVLLHFAFWKLAALFFTVCQGLAHLVFWGVGDTSAAAWFVYTKVLDVTFVAQLLFVSWEGCRGEWVSDRARRISGSGRGLWSRPFDALSRGVGRLGRLARSAFKARA